MTETAEEVVEVKIGPSIACPFCECKSLWASFNPQYLSIEWGGIPCVHWRGFRNGRPAAVFAVISDSATRAVPSTPASR